MGRLAKAALEGPKARCGISGLIDDHGELLVDVIFPHEVFRFF